MVQTAQSGVMHGDSETTGSPLQFSSRSPLLNRVDRAGGVFTGGVGGEESQVDENSQGDDPGAANIHSFATHC